MNERTFLLNRALSFRHDEGAAKIYIGLNPPKGLIVENDPPLIAEVIKFYTAEHTCRDLDLRFGDESKTAEAIFKELLALGVISEVTQCNKRFDRHHLYFSLFDVAGNKYDSQIEAKTVGLIGCGGIGSTCAMLLTAAGVGRIKLSDGDKVEESNLSRTILFREDNVGALKVDAAKSQLQRLYSSVKVETLPKMFATYVNDSQSFHEFFKDCDFLILSADKPKEVHEWANEIALEHDIPYLNAGYIESYGVVGPLTIPGETSCSNCAKLSAVDFRSQFEELNPNLQAASYGPLNALVSALAVNEVIRYFLLLPVASKEKMILVDSSNYETSYAVFKPHEQCTCGSFEYSRATDQFNELALIYDHERDKRSLNAIILDPLIKKLIDHSTPQRILDVGCGIGSMSRELAKLGHYVTATDISEEMLKVFRSRVTDDIRAKLTIIHGDATRLELLGSYDVILLTLLLDHIENPGPFLSAIRSRCGADTKVIVTVPHPFKDSGHWIKEAKLDCFEYKDFVITDYFSEKLMSFVREDSSGEVVTKVSRYKRQLSTYLNLISASGFTLLETFEPTPENSSSEWDGSVNFIKASRVPYFLTLVLIPGALHEEG